MNPFSSWTEADVAAFNAKTSAENRALLGIREQTIAATLDPVTRKNWTSESDLHDAIFAECRRRGWIALHGSMAHRAMRTAGEPDFTILADGGRVFFIEAKTARGKLSTSQQMIRHWAAKLGHTVHVVRSFEQFLEVVQ